MKKGFPNKILGFPIGWEDLGKVKKKNKWEDGSSITETEVHAFCRERVRVGKEEGSLFKYCPRCLIKITD